MQAIDERTESAYFAPAFRLRHPDYALVAPPTLAVSYPFVFTVLGVGVVGALPRPVARRIPDVPSALVTGLGAATVAGAAYAVVYATGIA